MEITANCSWSIAAPDWVSVEPSSGTGSASLVVRAEQNEELERDGVLVISGGNAVAEVELFQDGVEFSVDQRVFHFNADGTPMEFTVISTYDWQISIPEAASWVAVDPVAGKAGLTKVRMLPSPITDRVARDRAYITIDYGKSFMTLTVSQALPNDPPTIPELIEPEDGATEVKLNAFFSWTDSTDPDGDDVSYRLMLSEDRGATWKTTETLSSKARPDALLHKNSSYLWKVQAVDQFGAVSESELRSFLTGDGGIYKDGTVSVYQKETAGASKPVHLIFMGDGFIEEDYAEGGVFDKAVEQAVEALFSVEPYTSYRNYFRVSTVAVYSQERGATVQEDMSTVKAQQRITAFESVLQGGNTTDIGCNYEKVFEYALTVPGIDAAVLNDAAIFLIINVDAYAGTCMIDYLGRSVAMCPMHKGYFGSIISHEGGGHGFGRLLDEYRYYNDRIPDDQKSIIEEWRKYDPYFSYNIDLTGDREAVHWAHYFKRSGYKAVDMFEGAYFYNFGAWRPEVISCMEDNRAYYNAPSREAVVRRIMKASGSSFNLETFVKNDKIKADPTTKTANYVELSAPLAPPVLIQK